MKNFVKNIKQKIEAEIDRIEQQRTDRLDKIKQIVSCIQAALSSLHAAITKYRFENLQEEIHFFKVWKPEISSLLIYYVRLYRIENNRTGKSPSAQCKYLKNEYDHLKKGHPDEVFYNYYQSGKTESDHLFSQESIMIFFRMFIAYRQTGICPFLPCMIRVLPRFSQTTN